METKTPSLSRAFEAAPRSTFGTKVNIWSLGPFLGGVPSNQAEERRCVVKVDFDPPVMRHHHMQNGFHSLAVGLGSTLTFKPIPYTL